MQPINYLAQVADPFAQAAQGYKLGATIVDVEAKRAELARQQQLQQQQQQQLAQEKARFFANPNPTMRDAARFASILSPEQSKAFLPYMEGISKEQQQGVLKSTGQILSALQVNPETGIKILRERAVAARNGGDEDDASLFERIADAAADPARGPAMAFKALVQNTSMIPGAKEMFENIDKGLGTAREEILFPDLQAQKNAEMRKAVSDADKAAVDAKYAEKFALEDLKKKAADLGLTQAQTGSALAQTKKLGVETSKAALELEALKATGGLDPSKTFEQEEKLRKEYQTRTKVYGELGSTFSNIKSSAGAKSGPGDIALITGFMKMLDPGSVVRETEFATARDTAGLYTRLENSLKKAESGQFLQPSQRQEFVNLAKQYYESAQKKAGEDKKALGVVVKNYRLNPENVFGAEQTATPPLPTSATVGGKTYSRPASFTDAQWSDYLKANGVIQ